MSNRLKLSERIPDWRQYVGILEQIMLSASNMLISLVVVTQAGMAWFGIYSFVFVIATLAGAFLSTLLHRQMVLEIASGDTAQRQQVFLATILLQFVIMAIAGGLLAVGLLLAASVAGVAHYSSMIIATWAYVCFYNVYELCRQYLYVLDDQVYSLRCTALYCAALITGLILIVITERVAADQFVTAMYTLIAAALAVCLLGNRRCLQALLAAPWKGWSYVYSVLMGFLDQGRFRLGGMLVTWAQNQSMNPILMWMGGPLIVGYFSMARLMVMPMAVVNQGLTNSTTPSLRRLYQADGIQPLTARIKQLNRLNMLMSLCYLAALLLAHFFGLLERFVPEYDQVQWFLLIWVAALMITMYRFWLGQFFVVSLQFAFMMKVSIIAMVITLTGMIGSGLVLNNAHIMLSFMIIGEMTAVLIFRRHTTRAVATV